MEKTIWSIHAGKDAEADHLFRGKNRIAVGWGKVGDLSAFADDREPFKDKFHQEYPEKELGTVRVQAGIHYRFRHSMQSGDSVIYPCKVDKRVYLGEVGEYDYSTNEDPDYVHHRSVKWLKDLPRTSFSQAALYEIGSAVTLIQIKNNYDEFLEAFTGEVSEDMVATAEDDSAVDTSEIEQSTVDFIIKRLGKELKGHPFARFVGHLLETMGYHTKISPPGADGGIDVLAHKDELGFEPPIIKVQVKSGASNVGDPEVSALYGKVDKDEYGLFVTIADFTSPAKNFAAGKSNLRLINGTELVELVFEHYGSLDSKYRGLFPLKQVYIPDTEGDF